MKQPRVARKTTPLCPSCALWGKPKGENQVGLKAKATKRFPSVTPPPPFFWGFARSGRNRPVPTGYPPPLPKGAGAGAGAGGVRNEVPTTSKTLCLLGNNPTLKPLRGVNKTRTKNEN